MHGCLHQGKLTKVMCQTINLRVCLGQFTESVNEVGHQRHIKIEGDCGQHSILHVKELLLSISVSCNVDKAIYSGWSNLKIFRSNEHCDHSKQLVLVHFDRLLVAVSINDIGREMKGFILQLHVLAYFEDP